MKDTRPIEAQVEELTDKQKKTIIRVHRYGIIAILFTSMLSLVAMVLAAVMFLKIPKMYLFLNKFVIFIIAIVVVNLLICVGEYFVLKAKFPYYSDKKYSYIKKNMKKKTDGEKKNI